MSGSRIQIPNELGDKALCAFFSGWEWFDDPRSPVTLDFSTCGFVAPWAATLFAAYGIWLKEVRGKEVMLWIDDSSSTGQYLIQSNLPQLLQQDVKPYPPASSNRVFPLTRFSSSGEIVQCAKALLSLLQLEDGEMADAVRYALIELLRNVVQHSRSRVGGLVHAVYYPSTGLVDLVVADIGCGIRAALRERYAEIGSDFKAVKFALQPHVSGTFSRGAYASMQSNAGLGLFFIKEIATRAGGGFFLGSGSMLADLWGSRDGSPGKRYFTSRTPGWRGTFALLQLRRDQIGEFEGLLETCRTIAAAVRKDPTELNLDFIDEVPEIDGLTVVRVCDFEENVERAGQIVEQLILPALERDGLVVLDFSGIRAATQSFVHALTYRIFRDGKNVDTILSIARADAASREAVRAVAAYAIVGKK